MNIKTYLGTHWKKVKCTSWEHWSKYKYNTNRIKAKRHEHVIHRVIILYHDIACQKYSQNMVYKEYNKSALDSTHPWMITTAWTRSWIKVEHFEKEARVLWSYIVWSNTIYKQITRHLLHLLNIHDLYVLRHNIAVKLSISVALTCSYHSSWSIIEGCH